MLTCGSYPTKPNYEIVADCKMHSGGVFPQCRALHSLAEHGEQRCDSCQPDSSSVLSSHVTPTWLNMTNSRPQNKPKGGLLCNDRPSTRTSSALSVCKWGAAPNSSPPHPSPTINKHLITAFIRGGCPGILEKSSVFNWY